MADSGGSGGTGGSAGGSGGSQGVMQMDAAVTLDASTPGADTRCAPLPMSGTSVDVSDVDQLMNAVQSAQPNTTILLADGTYSLPDRILQLKVDGLSLRSKSGDRDKVVIDGAYSASTGEVIAITASNITISELTIAHAYTHAVHVQTTGSDVSGTTLYDVHVVDALEQAIKINPGSDGHYPDDGVIACSHIELTDEGRPQVRNNCYTGGVDAHSARGWQVRENLIEGFYCDSGLSEHGVHFWTGSRDTIVERNQIRNCARGVGLGLGETTASSTDSWRIYADDPCAGASPVGHYGGVVRNNFVFASDAALFASEFGFDSGMALEQACNASVVNNTVFGVTPPLSSAIEWRFANTSALIANNLANAPFKDRGSGATATMMSNLDNADATWFVDAANGDLHLAANSKAKGQGTALSAGLCDDDIDGESRTRPDVGADELP